MLFRFTGLSPYKKHWQDETTKRYQPLIDVMKSALLGLIYFLIATVGFIAGFSWSVPTAICLGATVFALLLFMNWSIYFKNAFAEKPPWSRSRVLLFTLCSFLISTSAGMTILVPLLGGLAMLMLLAFLGSCILANLLLFWFLQKTVYSRKRRRFAI